MIKNHLTIMHSEGTLVYINVKFMQSFDGYFICRYVCIIYIYMYIMYICSIFYIIVYSSILYIIYMYIIYICIWFVGIYLMKIEIWWLVEVLEDPVLMLF